VKQDLKEFSPITLLVQQNAVYLVDNARNGIESKYTKYLLLIFVRMCKKQGSFGNTVAIQICTCCNLVFSFEFEFKLLKTNQSVTTTLHFKAVHASHYFQHIRC